MEGDLAYRGLQWGGGLLKSGVFPREYARSRHYGVFYLQNLKVSTLRILKNSVGKVDDFAYMQK